MARATSSLPTPDSPSIRIGMFEAAALLRQADDPLHGRAAGDDVVEGERAAAPCAPSGALRLRSASTLSALAIAARSRSGETGLTTKSKAPARIADTTVSMPPCAVCTMTGSVDAALAHRLQHADAVDARASTRSSTITPRSRRRRPRRARQAPPRRLRPAARRSRSCVTAASQQAALDRIVVDDEDASLSCELGIFERVSEPSRVPSGSTWHRASK